MGDKEKFICLSGNHVMELDSHQHCSICGSDNVMSLAVIEKALLTPDKADEVHRPAPFAAKELRWFVIEFRGFWTAVSNYKGWSEAEALAYAFSYHNTWNLIPDNEEISTGDMVIKDLSNAEFGAMLRRVSDADAENKDVTKSDTPALLQSTENTVVTVPCIEKTT